MKKVLLADSEEIGTIGGPGLGAFGEWVQSLGRGREAAVEALTKGTTIISNLIGFLTIVAGIWFMFQFITAGISWISAGGNPESLNSARDRMRNALIGMVLVVGAWAIVGLIGNILGLDILMTDPGKIIDQLTP